MFIISMSFHRKLLLVISGLILLIIVFVMSNLPNTRVEMISSKGEIIPVKENTELTEMELKIINLLEEKDWIETASVSLAYTDEYNCVHAIVILDGTGLDNKKAEIVATITENIANMNLQTLHILDIYGNEIALS